MNAPSQVRPSALPDAWIDRLFDRLEAGYGSKWLNMWGNTNLANVKSLWAEKLAGFAENPKALAYALDCLDEHPFPPTLPEFLALCRKAPQPDRPALPAPAPNPEKAASFAKDAKAVTEAKKDLIGWARRPKSQMAFNALADLAKSDRQFSEILEKLTQAGHVVNGFLVNRWDGMAWVKV